MQRMVTEFWKRWSTSYYQSLVKYHKWRLKTRNAEPGDVVLVLDKEGPKGKFSLGIIASVKKDDDDVVRKVTVKYKLAQPKDKVDYQAKPYKYAERNVRGLALVVTAQERNEIEGIDIDKCRFNKNIEMSEGEESQTDEENDDHPSENEAKSNENDDKSDENDDKSSENDDHTNGNVEEESNSHLDDRKLPATSTGRKRWKPNKLDL